MATRTNGWWRGLLVVLGIVGAGTGGYYYRPIDREMERRLDECEQGLAKLPPDELLERVTILERDNEHQERRITRLEDERP